jgi:predicted permease
VIIGLAFGLLPSVWAGRSDLQHDMARGSSRTAGGRAGMRAALVVAQVALAVVLLVSSGLLMRSLGQLFHVSRGFDASSLLTMQVQLVGRRFDDPATANRFRRTALDAIRAVPGVEVAGYTSQLPLSGDRDEYGAHFSAVDGLPDETYGVFRYVVSPGYPETLKIPLLRGRMLDDRDVAGAPGAALISAALADQRFGHRDPIGQPFTIGGDHRFTIVGVVGNVKQVSLAGTDSAAVYLTGEQSWYTDAVVSMVARTHGDAGALAPAVRQAVWSVDKDQPIVRVATMAELLDASEAQRRFALTVFTAFAAAGLLLAAVGIYGVLAWSVSTRTREIGVRAALGATRGALVARVVRDGMTLTGAGIAAGLVGAAFATRALLTLLFGVSRLDPVTYLAVVGLLSAVAGLACWIPAARAARVDPVTALRGE